MKNIKYYVIILSLITKLNFSQSKLYKTEPTDNTQLAIGKIIEGIHIDTSEIDYFYIFHLNPNSCPRCEGLINPISNAIKDRNTKTIIIIVYDINDSRSAIKYQEQKKFIVDNIIVDVNSRLLKSLQLVSKNLTIPYLYKIRAIDNKMIYATPLLGINVSNVFIDTILKSKIDMPIISNKNTQIKKNYSKIVDTNKYSYSIQLNRDSDTLSTPKSCYYLPQKESVIWLDNIFSNLKLIDKKGNTISTFNPTENEYKNFVSKSVSNYLYDYLYQNNILNVIYLDIIDVKDNSIDVISSLPKVDLDIKNEDTTLDYYNEIAVLSKNIQTNESLISNVEMPSEFKEKGFFTKHSNLKKVNENILIFPLYKGWPTKGTDDFNKENKSVEYNSFTDSFYTECPLFIKFNKKDGTYKTFGELDLFSKKNRLGYFLYKPVFATLNDNLYFNDGISDIIKVIDLRTFKVVKEINTNINTIINNVNEIKISTLNSAIDYINYFLSFEQMNYEYINQMVIDEKGILYFSIKESKRNSVNIKTCNLKNGKVDTQNVFSLEVENEELFFNLYSINNKVYISNYIEENNIKTINIKKLN